MLLNITLPQWLINVWTSYSDVIVPALIMVLTALLTYVAITLKAQAKLNMAKTNIQIDEMKKLNAKEDTRPELNDLSNKIKDQDNKLNQMVELFNLAFQNSNLTPEIKCNLQALSNKMLYGSEDNYVKDLENQLLKYKEQLKALDAVKVIENAVEVNEEVPRR